MTEHPDVSERQSIGWSLASTLAVLGLALISDRLLPTQQDREESPSIVPSSRTRAEGAHQDRGRQATTPSEIPPRGWKDILRRVYANISKHRILALAAGMTYYSILAIFPAIAALVAVYGLSRIPLP